MSEEGEETLLRIQLTTLLPSFIHSMQYKQYYSALSATILCTAGAVYINWPSPSIPLLIRPDSPIGEQLTKEEASWVASSLFLGMMPGGVLAGLLLDKIGRKKSMLVSGLLLFVPWIIVIFSVSMYMLIVARLIAGLGVAIMAAVVPIYIGEISKKQIRGRLSSLSNLSVTASAIVVFGAGPFVSFTVLALISAAVPLVFISTYYFLPESPYYLVKTNHRQAAYEVLRSLSESANTDDWLKEIETTISHDAENKLTFKSLFTEPNYRKSLGIILGMKTLQQFSGLFAINAYLQTIMEETHTSLSADISSVIFAILQIPCVLISAYLTDKLGRRPLLAFSAAGCSIALLGEGMYFYLQAQNFDLSGIYFLPTLFLTFYFVMAAVGVHILPYVILGELFTTNLKKVGGGMFAFYSGFLSFVSLKIFNPITEAYGMYTVFWMFSGVCVLGVLFALFVLPETKGKRFEEIQDMLHGNRKKKEKTVTPSS